MILTGGFIAIVAYIAFCLLIGSISFDRETKKYFLIVLSAAFNFFWGLVSLTLFQMMYYFFINQPNGPGYYVPDSEQSFNVILGFFMLIVYLLLVLPINIYLKKKSGWRTKSYLMISLSAVAVGMLFSILFF